MTCFLLQLIASAEGQRDEYAKQVSELRDQYSRISSKNQDVDPLVHEELKTKILEMEKRSQELEKRNQDTLDKGQEFYQKLLSKSEELKKFKSEFADVTSKLKASQEANSKQQQELQNLQQLQNQLQEMKQQHQQQLAKEQHTIVQLEKTIANLKQELAQAVHASTLARTVAEPADPATASGSSKSFNLASSALPSAAVAQAVNLNFAAPEFISNSQTQPATTSTAVAPVPALAFTADSAADTEIPGEKRSSDNELIGSKQTKRVPYLFRPLLYKSSAYLFLQSKNSVSFVESPQVLHFSGSDPLCNDPVANCVTTPYCLRVSGFPPGESLTADVGKALFPNQVLLSPLLLFFK